MSTPAKKQTKCPSCSGTGHRHRPASFGEIEHGSGTAIRAGLCPRCKGLGLVEEGSNR